MNQVINTIFSRKGTKQYKSAPVSDADLQLLLKAGAAAPNAYNAQKWHFTAISNKEILAVLEKKVFDALVVNGVCKAGEVYYPFYQAPAVIVISADIESEFAKQDCSAANQNIAIAAKSIGLGSRFLDVPNYFFNSEEGKKYRDLCGLPECYRTVCFLSIGYPEDEHEEATPKKQDVFSFVR